MVNPKAIIFDKDGGLVDFHESYGKATGLFIASQTEKMVERELELRDALCQLLQYDWTQQSFLPHSLFIAGSLDYWITDWAKIIDQEDTPEFRESMLDEMREFSLQNVASVHGAEKALAWVKTKGVKMAILTNDGAQSAQQQIARLEMTDYFSSIVGYDSGYGPKPAPDGLLALCEKLNVSPSEAVMVGDTQTDMQAAVAAGVTPVAVATKYTPTDTLLKYVPRVSENLMDTVTRLFD